jgi:hypothetical protein
MLVRGCSRWWWQVMGSNHRRLSRRFTGSCHAVCEMGPDLRQHSFRCVFRNFSTAPQPRKPADVRFQPDITGTTGTSEQADANGGSGPREVWSEAGSECRPSAFQGSYRVGAENHVTLCRPRVYSWIRPPGRSRRRTRIPVISTGPCRRLAGGFCRSARCGRRES